MMRPVACTPLMVSILTSCLVLSGTSVPAADLVIQPTSPSFASCRQISLRLVLRDIAPGTALSGYQLYLRYAAAAVRPLRFEPEMIGATVYQAGAEPFGDGFLACVEWSDGEAEDVAAIGATIYPSTADGDVENLPDATELTLGTVFFEITTAVFGSTEVFFTAVNESCREIIDETTSVYDTDGAAIGLSLEDFVSVTLVAGGQAVEDLACSFDAESAVDLTWTLPEGSSYSALRIDRDGSEIAEIAGDAVSYRDETAAGLAEADYTLTPIVAGGVEGCSAGCTAFLEGVPFIRGDVNFDTRFNITDAVQILGSLVSGQVISCRDAADVDDDGAVVISDPIYGLNFLFSSGPAVPPPFGEPGLDPTDDELDCASP